jgi:hypothetical protein
MPKLHLPKLESDTPAPMHHPQIGDIWKYEHPDFGMGPQLILEAEIWTRDVGTRDGEYLSYQCLTLDMERDVTEKVVFCYSTNPFWMRIG